MITGSFKANAAMKPSKMEIPHINEVSKKSPKRVSPPARKTPTTRTVLIDRKSTRLNSSHSQQSRMPSSA